MEGYDPYDPYAPQPERPPGCAMPIAWILLAFVALVGGAAYVGWSGYNSESAGLSALWVMAFPVGFFGTGAFVGLVTHFVVKKASAARTFVPLGCGCLGGLVLLGAVAAFVTAIFPML